MRANAQLSLLAERLFPGSSYDGLLRSASVEDWTWNAVQRLRAECDLDQDLLSEAAWLQARQSLAESLAWMLLFRVPEDRLRTSVEAWIHTQAEMLRRLVADGKQIESEFHLPARRVVALDLDLSDRHSNGRTVAALHFDSGLKLIYKPRDIGIEAWFSAFQECLNQLGAPFAFRTLLTIARHDYGWTEFAAHGRCRDEGCLQRFYRNAGALLCLLHLLRATDCHFENLVACGETPVFVDAETLFQPALHASTGAVSVLRTGMLSRLTPLLPSTVARGNADLGGLSCVSPQLVPIPIPAFDGATDRLETALLTPEANVPFPAGDTLAPELFAEEVVDGFSRTWHFIAAHREAVVAALGAARSERIRYVVRDTLTYYQAIVAALCAKDLDGLTLPALCGSRAVFSPLQQEEQEQLRRLDIPRFTLRACETGLRGAAGCFPESGFELARGGIQSASDEEMEKQVAAIRVSWAFYGAAKTLVGVTKV